MPPHRVFAQTFAELFVAAGNPSMRRVAVLAEARMHSATGRDRSVTASSQRISDWVAGRNVPARFDSLVPVLLTLIDAARKHGCPPTDPLLDLQWWRRLWKETEARKTTNQVAPCPYPGLAPYGSSDFAVFFGRATATEEFTALVVAARNKPSGFAVLVGASGAGKSSLLAAGLIPALSASWHISVLTPGSSSIGELRETIDAHKQHSPALVIVDQFEDLFTTDRDEPDRTEFLRLLDQFASQPDHSVVLALRADRYARCLDYPVLAAALECRSYVLGPMRSNEIAQAISCPAEVAGLKLDPGLTDLVIVELYGLNGTKQVHDPGALPLLSHVMTAVWQRREGKRLTVVGYRAAGGVAGSIAAIAEQAWATLTGPEQVVARRLLLSLIAVGNDSRDSRRRMRRAQLLTDAGGATAAALEALARTRLVTLDRAESSIDPIVYLAHEIVIDAWPRLRNWIDADRVSCLLRQRLETDAAEWSAAQHDSSLLYRGTRLAATADLAAQLPDNTLAAEFLTASRAHLQRSRRLALAAGIMLVILCAVVLALAIAAYGQSRQAIGQHNEAIFAATLAETNSAADPDPSPSAHNPAARPAC